MQHAAFLEPRFGSRCLPNEHGRAPCHHQLDPTCRQPDTTSLTPAWRQPDTRGALVRAAAQQEFDERAQAAAAEAERKAAAQAQADAFQAEQDAFRDQMKTDAP